MSTPSPGTSPVATEGQAERPDSLESPAFLLARVGRVAARRLNDQLAATGLKSPHAAILLELRAFGPTSQQALGERLHIDPSNLVGFLNALEDDGLLVRRRDPADRRRHIVEITDEGVKRLPACDDPVELLEDQLFAGLSAREREQLRTLLGRILTTVSAEDLVPDEG
jgi:DNA-binding MarR family transcriptional regulator